MDRAFEDDENTLPVGLKKICTNLLATILVAKEDMLIKLTSRVTIITYFMVTGFGCPNSRTYNTLPCPILSHVNPKSRTENMSLCPIGIKSRTENTSLCPILGHGSPKSRTENMSLCPIGINLGQKTSLYPILNHLSPKSRTVISLCPILSHISPTHSPVTNFSNSNCNLILSVLTFSDNRHFPVKSFSMLACHHKIFPGVKRPRREADHSKTYCGG